MGADADKIDRQRKEIRDRLQPSPETHTDKALELDFNQGPDGATIVSRITNMLGTLKSLSQNQERNFNLFTHHKLLKEGKTIERTYENLKEAVLELYLSVKIRSDEEIDNYNENMFGVEKDEMKGVDGFTLIDYIKSSVEILMNMKQSEDGDDIQLDEGALMITPNKNEIFTQQSPRNDV